MSVLWRALERGPGSNVQVMPKWGRCGGSQTPQNVGLIGAKVTRPKGM